MSKWQQDEPHVYRLRVGGTVLATVHEVNWKYSVWSLESANIGGSAKSTYAAMRAVRKALREGATAPQEPSDGTPR